MKPNDTEAQPTKPAATILVVDDNPINLKLVADLLAFEGYRVLKAVDGEEAAHRVQEDPPELILLDVDLPGIDGLTLTKRLKGDSRTADIIIVALTAFAMKGDRQRAIAAGCDAYVTKPIDTRELPAQVAELLQRREKTKT
ncbi:MAG TPA: response regulator [Chthoniobacterales bacterium]|nr:response regulator [Chthoniobacterales bacterium]